MTTAFEGVEGVDNPTMIRKINEDVATQTTFTTEG